MQKAQANGDDEALLTRIAAGEQAGLRRLMDRHGRGLRLFAQRYLGNGHDAEEAVQDVFVAVWKHAGRFDAGRGKATTWLYKLAANRCIDMRRWKKLRAFVGIEDMDDVVAADAPLADAMVWAREEIALVRQGLMHLPDRQRMALLLRAVGDLDVPEIAQVMGASAGSIEQLLVRARRTLRIALDDRKDLAE